MAKSETIKIKPAEIEKKIVELAKEGAQPDKIGLILRDQHGVPKVKLIDKKINQILKEAGIQVKPEKEIVEEKVATLKAHIEKNKHDYPAQRSLTKKLWTIHHLS